MAAAAVVIMMASGNHSNSNTPFIPLTAGEREFLGYAIIVCGIIIVACLIRMWWLKGKE